MTEQVPKVYLEEHYRGDDFQYGFELINGYTSDDVTDLIFTIRNELPASDVEDDDDAIAQVSLGDGIEFTDSTNGIVTIEASNFATLTPGRYQCDLQGVVNGLTKTISRLELPIISDITRN